MNLPNKLTLIRVMVIPLFLLFMLFPFNGTPCDGVYKWIALAIFISASLTDLVDGKIARKYNLVTNFGKFMDPLADKMLVCSALICLVELERISSLVVIVIVVREFVISGLRLIASDNGVVIAASSWGKWKTTFQMIMIGFMIGNVQLPIFVITTEILMWIAVVLTVISLFEYIIKNVSVLKTEK